MKEPSILSRRTESSRRNHGVRVQNLSGSVRRAFDGWWVGGINISVLRSEIVVVFRWVGRRAHACGWTCFRKTKEIKCQIIAIILVKINSKSVLN